MSGPDARLNLIAQRQLQALGRMQGYLADRMEILNTARGWLIAEQGDEDPDIMDVLSVAEFLAGDRITES